MSDTVVLNRVAAPPRVCRERNSRQLRLHLQISDSRALGRVAIWTRSDGVLGMDVLERGAGRASLGVRGATPLVYLVEKAGIASVPRRGKFGLFHFALLLPD